MKNTMKTTQVANAASAAMLKKVNEFANNRGAWVRVEDAPEFVKKCAAFKMVANGGALNDDATEKYFYMN